MESIKLTKIIKKANRAEYLFEISEGLRKFFSGKPFFIEYSFPVEEIPDGILSVPFVSSTVQVAWIADARLEIPALDRAFYDCLPELKKGYEAMFPETVFAGQLQVERIEEYDIPLNGGCATLFSGGLDSVHTLIRHIEEKPALISIWGADVAVDNEEGWKLLRVPITEYANQYGLETVTIRSAFRSFDLEWEFDKVYQEQLHSNWWYGIKHGLALLGHVAPVAYVKGLGITYIASSNSDKDEDVRCASDPSMDNCVQFVNCRVIHDAFEFGRQDKVQDIVDYVRKSGQSISLHVCWESQSGSNCCQCEKCFRTMLGLMIEGEDPIEYGFADAWDTLGSMRRIMVGSQKIGKSVVPEWSGLQKAVKEKRNTLSQKDYWKYIKWILDVDMSHPEKTKLPVLYRVRVWLSQIPVLQKIYGSFLKRKN